MKIVNSIDSETENVICAKLREFNNANCAYFATHSREENKQNFLIYDKEELIGAGLGVVRYNWFYLDILYIDETYRKQHLGTKLMKHIEEFARKEKLTGIRVETWDFQALGFYKANGYEVFGEIQDCPPGTIEYHLKKVL